MPRVRNTRPTNIYWLYDTRPETIAKGWVDGYPFYCGKTVYVVRKRLGEHRGDALKPSKRPVCGWVAACGDHIRIQTVQVVPVGGDWVKAERAWIKRLRATVLICANVSDGGGGMAGYVFTKEQRARMSASQRARSPDPARRARKAAERLAARLVKQAKRLVVIEAEKMKRLAAFEAAQMAAEIKRRDAADACAMREWMTQMR